MKTKPASTKQSVEFRMGDYVVYPAHGVGKIDGVDSQTIGGIDVRLYTISFEKDRMRLKVPVMKAESLHAR